MLGKNVHVSYIAVLVRSTYVLPKDAKVNGKKITESEKNVPDWKHYCLTTHTINTDASDSSSHLHLWLFASATV